MRVYDAWGNHKIYNAAGVDISNPTGYTEHVGRINPFRYRGYYYDDQLGMYYLKSRFYDPKVKRFTSPDDLSYLDPETVNGLNLYAYCRNNPVMYADPSGHFWDVILDAISVAWSIYDLISEPSWINVGWLALDLAFAVVPFLTGNYLIKSASKLDEVAYIGKGINRFDDVYDVVVLGNNMDRVANMALDIGGTFYGGYQPLNTIVALGKASDVTKAMKQVAKLDNVRFILDKYYDGYRFVHVGSDGRGLVKMMRSAYGMELKVLYRLKFGNKMHKAWWIFNTGRRAVW